MASAAVTSAAPSQSPAGVERAGFLLARNTHTFLASLGLGSVLTDEHIL